MIIIMIIYNQLFLIVDIIISLIDILHATILHWSQHVNNHFSTMNLATVNLFDLVFPSSQPIDSPYFYNYNEVIQ